nr:(+)-6a-hydroxymaackiain 3-o-methyltransferase 2 [Quercus suber]
MSGTKQLSFKLVPGENATELLNAQAQKWNHIFNFVNSMSLKCAIELGIPDIIHNHGKPMTLSELITALPIHPTKSPHVYRLMRILIHSGFFAPKITSENDQEEAYALTEPSSEAMASDARLVMNVVVDKCKSVFEGLESFVDVGGGIGTVAKAIADTFPDIECTVFDPPHVVADFQGSKNLKYVGGDMFEAIPPADAVFMKLKYIFALRIHHFSPSSVITSTASSIYFAPTPGALFLPNKI